MVNEVKRALLKVPKIYLEYPTKSGTNKNDERAFAYEFYHQLRSGVLNDIHITGETRKRVPCIVGKSEFDIKRKTKSKSTRPRKTKPKLDEDLIPDILIHLFNIDERNEVAIELKVSKKLSLKEIYDDLKKLVRLADKPRYYKKLIFIAANCNIIDIINEKIPAKDLRNNYYKKFILDTIETNENLTVWNVIPVFELDPKSSDYDWASDRISEDEIHTVIIGADFDKNDIIRVADFNNA